MLTLNPLAISDVYLFKLSSNRNITTVLPCVMEDGGWTVIQRRFNDSLDFNRTWDDYVNGFGDPSGNFWLGLEAMHLLSVNVSTVRLKIVLEAFDGEDVGPFIIYYDNFSVGNADSSYQLTLSGFSCPEEIGDSLIRHSGMKFSTKDNEQDIAPNVNCAEMYGGGWWYKSCHGANTNAIYMPTSDNPDKVGILWRTYREYYSFRASTISIQ